MWVLLVLDSSIALTRWDHRSLLPGRDAYCIFPITRSALNFRAISRYELDVGGVAFLLISNPYADQLVVTQRRIGIAKAARFAKMTTSSIHGLYATGGSLESRELRILLGHVP